MDTEPESLSPSAARMLALRTTILDEWEQRVRASVDEAKSVDRPTLINTFPSFLRLIAEALSSSQVTVTGADVTPYANEHGGIRARIGQYGPQDVVREYQLLRQTVFDVLEKDGVRLAKAESALINALFEAAIRESVTAYALVHTALKEQFAAALAHDLRTPLAAANAAAEIILRTAESTSLKALATRILENHQRIDKMVRDLLDTIVFHSGARLQLDLSHFDMLGVVRDICDSFTATSARQVRIECDGTPITGHWARDAIERALENLIGNAVKYAPPDTIVTVRVHEAEDRLTITVHNDGAPIPIEEQEGIFQIFQRASNKGRSAGWGIGLPYARVAAESHGGSVLVDSTESRGTNFIIDLPLDSRPYQNVPVVPLPQQDA